MNKIAANLIARVLKNSNDYISHDAALFLHGFLDTSPRILRIVSRSRKRNREVAGNELVFIYHKPERPAETVFTNFLGAKLRIATPAQALVDILSDSQTGIAARKIAQWFWKIPFDVTELLDLAHRTRPTTFKRALALSIWAGKTNTSQHEQFRLNPSPGYLFPGEKEGLIWDNTLKIFYPDWLLKHFPDCEAKDFPGYNQNWLELRRHPGFICFMAGKGDLNGFGDIDMPRKVRDFFADEQQKLACCNSDKLILGFASNSRVSYPSLVLQHARKHFRTSKSFKFLFKKLLANAFSGRSLEIINHACFAAADFHCFSEAFRSLPEKLAELFKRSLFNGVLYLLEKALAKRVTIPLALFIFAARALATKGDFCAANEYLKIAAELPGLSDDEAVDLHFARGVIHRQNCQYQESLFFLKKAMAIAGKKENIYRIASIKSSIANVYMFLGKPAMARTCYLEAFKLCKDSKISSFNTNIQTNLALLEFLSGNLAKAKTYFKQVVQRQTLENNPKGTFLAEMSLAKIDLARGEFWQCIKRLNKLEKSGLYSGKAESLEIQALKAWALKLSGMPVRAQFLWEEIKSASNEYSAGGTFFFLKFIEIMLAASDGNLKTAVEIIDELLSCSVNRSFTRDEAGCLIFYKGVFLNRLKQVDIMQTMEQALQMFSEPTRHPVGILIRIIECSQNCRIGKKNELPALIRSLKKTGYYEPLWPLFADLLSCIGDKNPNLIAYFLPKTNPLFLRKIVNSCSLPFMKKNRKALHQSATRIFFKDGTCQKLTAAEFKTIIKKDSDCQTIFVDKTEGMIKMGKNAIKVSPKSRQGQLLLCVLEAHPMPLSLPLLFKLAWQERYDEAIDTPALKTCLYRTRKLAMTVNPDLGLVLNRNKELVLTTPAKIEIFS